MPDSGHRYFFGQHPEMPWKAPKVGGQMPEPRPAELRDPVCRNHPDRPGIAHFGKTYTYSLCLECLDKRIASNGREPLDEHGKRLEVTP